MNKDEIIRRVRIALEESHQNESNITTSADDTVIALADTDEEALDTLIMDKAREALVFVLQTADPSFLTPTILSLSTTAINPTNETKAPYLKRLPEVASGESPLSVGIERDKFLRFMWATTSQWKGVYITEFIPLGDKESSRLSNPLSTGTTERPAIGEAVYRNGDKVYEEFRLYSVTNKSASVTFAYIEYPEYNEEEGWPVTGKIEDAFVHYLTYLVMQTLNDTKADEQMAQAMVAMGRSDALKGNANQ